MNKKIGVLGCGWLGFPLAKYLLANNHHVYGSTTSIDKLDLLKENGIHPFHISLSTTEIKGDIQSFLSNIEILIINIPPRLRGNNTESFVDKITLLHAEVKKSSVKKLIFISSTSVYGNVNGTVTEATVPKPSTASGRQLLECEERFLSDESLNTTIIRFGGLIGPNRHPVTMLSKRSNLNNGDSPINLIHLDDCIHMINTIIENDYWNEVFNGVYPLHPSKKEYYTAEAQKRGLPAPDYLHNSSNNSNKIVINQNFIDKSHQLHTSIVS